MALPFLIIPAAIGIAGLWGGKKTYDAWSDSGRANDINDQASRRIRESESILEKIRKSTQDTLEMYGRQKLDALDKNVGQFLTLFKQIKNAEIGETSDLENLQVGAFSGVTIRELQTSCELAVATLQGLGSGAGAGALMAFGAYNGTMLFATASTGTAIGTLSGAAATNATLAWLGGGALSAGGLGMAGGTMVLGTLVAGPALLVFGSILAAKASEKLDKAKANREQSEAYVAEVDVVCQKLFMIESTARLAQNVLSTLRAKSRRANYSLAETIRTHGTDYSTYGETERHSVLQAVKFVQLVKVMIDTILLNDDGELLPDSRGRFEKVQKAVLSTEE